jgi:hypothetical protein
MLVVFFCTYLNNEEEGVCVCVCACVCVCVCVCENVNCECMHTKSLLLIENTV